MHSIVILISNNLLLYRPRFARDLRVEKLTVNTLLMRSFSTVDNEHVLACVRGYLKKIGTVVTL